MKCYLHIGTEKTGTTTIQSFFSKNREKLVLKNYYYPKSLGLSNHRLLSLAAYNPQRRDDYTKKLGLFSDEDLMKYQTKILQNFKSELNQLPTETKIICSNEHIQSRLTTLDEINRLHIILKQVGIKDITIIVYLRNPSEIANSLFSTAIKSGSTEFEVPQPSNKYYDNICNHKKTIENYTSVFGKKNVVVRLFQKEKFVNQSLIHDISKIIGLNSLIDKLALPENKNESLSLIGIKILRNLNETIPVFEGNIINKERKDLVNYISKYFSNPKFVMDEKSFLSYNSKYLKSNQWIRENYFPEEEVLFLNEHKKSIQTDISDDELKKITDFITEIWTDRSNILNDKWFNFGKLTKKEKLIKLCNLNLKVIKRLTNKKRR
ncbi:sulfotransferase domain-containing protein [Formosa algae]|uniref:sulfotransferase domain-containing protein n=1 Tax=Formosa algae TaxID=225843 RepID=UPI000CCE0368|nr:sulfotransferase domain-containing protein [Formosa algae]PNW26319.1 hypothetical protein BKP44_17400 [Formosa algae]